MVNVRNYKGRFKFIFDYMKKCTNEERWIDVDGFDNQYKISNTGKLVGISERILSDDALVTLTRNKTERNTFKIDNIVIKKFAKVHDTGPEIWESIDWNPVYQVSNYGRLRSIKVFDVSVSSNLSVVLMSGKKRKSVSFIQLYMKAFPPYANPASSLYEDKRPNVIK